MAAILVAPNHTSAAASRLTSGYADRSGQVTRSPTVRTTASPTEAIPVSADRHRGSFLACAAAMAAAATAVMIATACTAFSA